MRAEFASGRDASVWAQDHPRKRSLETFGQQMLRNSYGVGDDGQGRINGTC